MKIAFDKFDNYETPDLILCNPGSTFSESGISRSICNISQFSDLEFVLNFNSVSTMSFRIYLTRSDNGSRDKYLESVFSSIQKRRYIFVPNIGYFQIDDVSEEIDFENASYKDVTARSCEVEFANRAAPYIPVPEDIGFVTVPLVTDTATDTKGIVDYIMDKLPSWNYGYIDNDVKGVYRSFEEIDIEKSAYDFMTDELQNAYECIFVFDTINRLVNIYAMKNYGKKTDIHLTINDVVSHIKINESSDGIYTALSVRGQDDIVISAVNPLGGNVIYRFDYYTDWMSDGLGEKVLEWEELVEENALDYYQARVGYQTARREVITCQQEISRINIQLGIYNECRQNIVETQDTSCVIAYDEEIQLAGGELIVISSNIQTTLDDIDRIVAEKQAEMSDLQDDAAEAFAESVTYGNEMDDINYLVSMNEYFTEGEFEELSNYIFEGVYTDENAIITDIMSYDEQLDVIHDMYTRGLNKLKDVSSPVHEFNVETNSFIFSKVFEKLTEQLETGCLINVEIKRDKIELLFLTSITINYEEGTSSLTFGNHMSKFDPRTLFKSVFDGISGSIATL